MIRKPEGDIKKGKCVAVYGVYGAVTTHVKVKNVGIYVYIDMSTLGQNTI